MNARTISRRSAAGATLATIVAASRSAAWAQSAPFEFKCLSSQPPDHPATIRATQLFAAIRQESKDRLQIQFFPNSMLGGDAAMLGQLRVGAAQMMMIAPANLAPVVPAIDIMNLGFGFKDADEALMVMDGPLGDHVREEVVAKGLYPLKSIYDGGMYHVGSATHPIGTPDDFHGFKVRVAAGRIMTDLFHDLGASPAPISASEMYTAQQTKVIDGVTLPLIAFESWKMYEVSKYMSLTNHSWSGIQLTANLEAWNKLPSDLQKMVERSNTKYALLERVDAKQSSASLAAKLQTQGITINRVDQTPFRKVLGTYYASWAETFGSTSWGLLEKSLKRKMA